MQLEIHEGFAWGVRVRLDQSFGWGRYFSFVLSGRGVTRNFLIFKFYCSFQKLNVLCFKAEAIP